MDDEDRRVEVALFRYGCIAELLQRKLPRGEQTRILQRLANQEWEAPGGEKVRLSVSTLKSWLARYRKGGFEALKPKPRKDRGKPRALTPALIERAAQLKRELPARSIPQIIRMLEADPDSGVAKGSISRATLHRHLHALGLTRRQPGPRRVYQRFEREQPGELWQIDQADGIFLPDPRRPGKFRKTVLFVVIDDYSRYCPHAQFYPDGKMPRLEHCMRQALAKAGIPEDVYVDRAGIHVSRHFRAACAALGIQVILGRRKNPAARGKVERFNQTVQNEVYPELRLLVAREEVKTVEEANAYFWAWLEEDYHRRPHSETGEPPRDRYFRKPPKLPDPVALANLFLTRDTRTVRKDATIRIGSNRYQVDPELRDRQKVEVRYDPFDLTRVEVWVDGRFYQVAVPLTLNKTSLSRSTETAPAPAQLSMSYLKLLRSQHDHRLAEEIERLRFSELPKTSLPGATGGVAPFLALLHLGLGRNLTEAETREAREFWATYGPLDIDLCREALEHACRHLGTGRHISIYLEEIRKRTRR
ncbi:MAG: DDE-type integrase/transposase/recombinase [Firmicutes bacterium]|nr:DDE-type integrase/transposase/recombinase [Candidatus Fermentithermobacillaceae bacterium]